MDGISQYHTLHHLSPPALSDVRSRPPPSPDILHDSADPVLDLHIVDCCCQMPAIVSSVRPEDCQDCVHSCDNQDCAIEITEQCTDQCVVVACDDPNHVPLDPALEPICDAPCTDEHCATLDEFFACCMPNFHSAHPRPGFDPSVPQNPAAYPWDPSFDALLANANQAQFQQHQHQHQHHHNHPHLGVSGQVSSPAFTGTSDLYPSSPTFDIPHHSGSGSHGHNTPVSPALSAVDQAQPPSVQPLRCMWGNCNATFGSLSDLVGHVNLQHLRLPTNNVAQQQQQQPQQGLDPHQHLLPDALSCLWADCHLYPTPNSVPGPSNGNPDSALGVLASHLLQDHLGLSTITPPSQNHRQSPNPHTAQPNPSRLTPPAASSIAGPPTPGPEHDCAAPNAHVCRWEGCGVSFTSCDALTKHITEAHVGGGKAHYDCFWEGCKRNGEAGFASKQKICRHLQSHTGHRPFQCQVCQQNFSEAATLAQHMRRHTQEKPYVCDFPGCGKSFAITGALTIHKRTHNGHKPFKCTYCERAFAESSNLSKHLRTHTGARPYACTYPECTKTFARPDQLARHTAVHKKNDLKADGAGQESSMQRSGKSAGDVSMEVS